MIQCTALAVHRYATLKYSVGVDIIEGQMGMYTGTTPTPLFLNSKNTPVDNLVEGEVFVIAAQTKPSPESGPKRKVQIITKGLMFFAYESEIRFYGREVVL